MFDLAANQRPREAQYCSQRGRRLSPRDGERPEPDQSVAVLVFETGESVAVLADTLIGREPMDHHNTMSGQWRGLQVDDDAALMSRMHLLLRTVGWEIEAVDLGSRNGSFVALDGDDWVRLLPGVPYRLANGQKLKVGGRRFAVHPVVR